MPSLNPRQFGVHRIPLTIPAKATFVALSFCPCEAEGSVLPIRPESKSLSAYTEREFRSLPRLQPPRTAQTSNSQERNRSTGASMSLIRKSDVRNHLSTRSGSTSIFPSRPTRPDAAPDTASRVRKSRAHQPDINVSPDGPTTPVPNPSIGDSLEFRPRATCGSRS